MNRFRVWAMLVLVAAALAACVTSCASSSSEPAGSTAAKAPAAGARRPHSTEPGRNSRAIALALRCRAPVAGVAGVLLCVACARHATPLGGNECRIAIESTWITRPRALA
jgi:hypothetical protein